MKLLDLIKNKIINFLAPNLIEDYKELKNNNQVLEEQYSALKEENETLENNYDMTLEYNVEKEKKIKELTEINSNYKKYITNKILQELEPKLKQMTLSKLEFLYRKLNYEDILLKEIYSDRRKYDVELEIYLSKGELIDEVSEELLGDEELWHLFPEEDARGTFEFTNGYDNTRWREKYYFGKVVNIEYVSCYEFYTYKLDKSNMEYVDYRKKLYREVIPREIEKYLSYILKFQPKILENTKDFLKELDEMFINENKQILYEKNKMEYNEMTETEDEEEI